MKYTRIKMPKGLTVNNKLSKIKIKNMIIIFKNINKKTKELIITTKLNIKVCSQKAKI